MLVLERRVDKRQVAADVVEEEWNEVGQEVETVEAVGLGCQENIRNYFEKYKYKEIVVSYYKEQLYESYLMKRGVFVEHFKNLLR